MLPGGLFRFRNAPAKTGIWRRSDLSREKQRDDLGAQIRPADRPEGWAHNVPSADARGFIHSRPELLREHLMWQYAAELLLDASTSGDEQ
jgi:hypothetical protein